jgi:hypothetical protein
MPGATFSAIERSSARHRRRRSSITTIVASSGSTVERLRALLGRFHVDASQWGKERAKSVEDLNDELRAGTCILSTIEDEGQGGSKLCRKVRIARLRVMREGRDGQVLVL